MVFTAGRHRIVGKVCALMDGQYGQVVRAIEELIRKCRQGVIALHAPPAKYK